jgi:flavin-dependent dehydrogenase
MTTPHDFDVTILGHGLAGAFLARQLRLELGPDLRILVLESAHAIRDYKVGESTVEVAANYMIRRLGLQTYLYQHQLPKNGVRFFFDNATKSLPLTEMSEMGTDRLPFHPAFQLERASFERDLLAMNLEAGVDVRLGTDVIDVTLAPDGPHTVVFRNAAGEQRVTTRFVVDAAGRRQFLLKKLGVPIHKETRLNTASSWARFKNVRGFDARGDEAWRDRVRHTSRHLSTNHLMYDGYWIWFIPLAGDLMSVGVVFDKDRIPERPLDREAFCAFVKRHAAGAELLEGAELVDFEAYAHLPYYADRYFSEDRWATTGFAGAFVDPFYSPGSDFIAIANEMVVELVKHDRAGDTAGFRERVDVFNQYYRFWYERTLRIYARLYATFGSYEVFRLKYMLDFNNYYNLVVWPFMADKYRDVAWLRGELRFVDRVIQAQDTMATQFVALADMLRSKGEYHAQNEGHWHNVLAGVIRLQDKLGKTMDETFRRDQVQAAYSSVFGALVERMSGHAGISNRQAFLGELSFPTVVLFKDVTTESVGALFDRVGLRLKKALAREFPETPITRVVVRPDEAQVELAQGTPDDALAARARELWEARGDSLAHIVL